MDGWMDGCGVVWNGMVWVGTYFRGRDGHSYGKVLRVEVEVAVEVR